MEGLIDWDHLELLLHHAFYNELQVSPESCPVLLAEPPLNPTANRVRQAQFIFETFRVPALYTPVSSALALYASGRTSGLVVNLGELLGYTVPVYEGHALPHAAGRLDFAGRDLTDYLQQLLLERGYLFSTAADREIVKCIKEKLAYIPLDNATPAPETSYVLPDGQVISVGDERCKCPEALFQPSLIGSDCWGLGECVFDSVMRCDGDVRREMCMNVVLEGGTTMFLGTPERLKKELERLVVPAGMQVKVIAPLERKYSVWIGGSIVGSLSNFPLMWISKQEYQEVGPAIVQRRCY
uniref:Actin n=1 Tax=Arcella intermedia TaxID=1963864 RepID=A0A6B2L8R4_9EUKA